MTTENESLNVKINAEFKVKRFNSKFAFKKLEFNMQDAVQSCFSILNPNTVIQLI